ESISASTASWSTWSARRVRRSRPDWRRIAQCRALSVRFRVWLVGGRRGGDPPVSSGLAGARCGGGAALGPGFGAVLGPGSGAAGRGRGRGSGGGVEGGSGGRFTVSSLGSSVQEATGRPRAIPPILPGACDIHGNLSPNRSESVGAESTSNRR